MNNDKFNRFKEIILSYLLDELSKTERYNIS